MLSVETILSIFYASLSIFLANAKNKITHKKYKNNAENS